MDDWKRWFATTGVELELRDALVALERVLARPGLDPTLRITLEAAAVVLREEESGDGRRIVSPPDTGDLSRSA